MVAMIFIFFLLISEYWILTPDFSFPIHYREGVLLFTPTSFSLLFSLLYTKYEIRHTICPLHSSPGYTIIIIGRSTNTSLSLIHISEPTRRTPISYAVFCLKKKK